MNDDQVEEALEYRGNEYNDHSERKNRERANLDAYYKVPLTNELADDFQERDKQSNCTQYKSRDADAKNAFKDFKRFQKTEDEWREKEDRYEKALNMYMRAKTAEERGEASEADLITLQQGSITKLKEWHANAMEKRSIAMDKKEKHWTKHLSIKTELNNLLKVSGGNSMGTSDNNERYKIYKSAPSYVEQPLKRPEKEVAKDFATQLCYSANLKKLNYYKIAELVKEYWECFDWKHEMHGLLGQMYKRITENKDAYNRKALAIQCFPALNHKNQGTATTALRSVEGDYEMRVSAVPKLELKQRYRDNKTEEELTMRSKTRRKHTENNYKKLYDRPQTSKGGSKRPYKSESSDKRRPQRKKPFKRDPPKKPFKKEDRKQPFKKKEHKKQKEKKIKTERTD